MKKIFITFLFTILSFSICNAENKSEILEAKKFIENLGNSVIQISQNSKLSGDEKSNKIISLIDNSIDSSWISRFVLGVHYNNINEVQKEKFKDLYRQFMVNTYGPKFKNYQGTDFIVNDISKQNRFYLVKTDFITKKTEPAISIDFRVRKLNNNFVVLDFIAEGISLIETQRSEFGSTISKNGMDKFLEDLNLRVSKLKN